MKKVLAVILLLTVSTFSQIINGRVSSSVYTFERFDSKTSSSMYVRGYQALNLSVGKDNFFLRTSLNFENSYSNTLDQDPRLRFYSLYLDARNLFGIATIKLGRQPVTAKIGGGNFDGLSAKIDYFDFTLNAFYGGNVPAYQKLELTKDFGTDFVYGAGLTSPEFYNFTVKVDYYNKNSAAKEYYATRLDELLNPITKLIRKNSMNFQFISGGLNYSLENLLDVTANYEYDLNYMETSLFEADLSYYVTKDLDLQGYFNVREPRIRYNSIFSVFDFGNTSEIEFGAGYKIIPEYTVSGRFGMTEYTDESAGRVSLGLATPYGSLNYRNGFGYAGELNSITAGTSKSFFDGLITPSIAVSYVNYKLSKDEESQSMTSLLGGVNYRPFNKFSADLQVQYLNNKIYSNDLRFLLKLNHWFNADLQNVF